MVGIIILREMQLREKPYDRLTNGIRIGRWSALGPAQSLALLRFFGWHPACRRDFLGREEAFIESANQGHMPALHWRSGRARRIPRTLCAIRMKDQERIYFY